MMGKPPRPAGARGGCSGEKRAVFLYPSPRCEVRDALAGFLLVIASLDSGSKQGDRRKARMQPSIRASARRSPSSRATPACDRSHAG